MATRHLHGWNVHWYPANRQHPAYAAVHLHGQETNFLQSYRVSEYFNIPLQPGYRSDRKAIKELVKHAMKISQNKWTGRVV